MGKVYIIAEAGVNHNGSIERAKQMIYIAAKAGADAIKFQTFKTENLVGKKALKAQYQIKATDKEESQYDMLKKLEIDEAAHVQLMACCKKNNIEFLSTPFDLDSLKLLTNDCKLSRIKISSGEITNAPFLLQIAETNKAVILSTGMCSLSDIETALGILAFGYLNRKDIPSLDGFLSAYASEQGQRLLQENVTLLHCTTEYPTPVEDVNLRCIDTLKRAFHLPVGYSDHTVGIAIPMAAIACGATIIEKHFTLDRTLPGPDHNASLEPLELENMVRGIRQIEMALGTGIKVPAKSEIKNKTIIRKSLVAKIVLRQGDVFTCDNMTTKRPGNGISPVYYWNQLGRKAERDYQPDEKV